MMKVNPLVMGHGFFRITATEIVFHDMQRVDHLSLREM